MEGLSRRSFSWSGRPPTSCTHFPWRRSTAGTAIIGASPACSSARLVQEVRQQLEPRPGALLGVELDAPAPTPPHRRGDAGPSILRPRDHRAPVARVALIRVRIVARHPARLAAEERIALV